MEKQKGGIMTNKEVFKKLEEEFNKYQEKIKATKSGTTDYSCLLSEQLGFIKCMVKIQKLLEGEK